MNTLDVIDSIRDHYNNSYKHFLSIIEDMRIYDWSKETCLSIMSDTIRSCMTLDNEYVDKSKLDIKSIINIE
jgi:hypothetical protein